MLSNLIPLLKKKTHASYMYPILKSYMIIWIVRSIFFLLELIIIYVTLVKHIICMHV